MNDVLAEVAALVQRESGIRMAPNQYRALEAALDRTAPQIDPSDFVLHVRNSLNGRDTVARLIDEVAVNETFFLRDKKQLQRIDWRLLLEGARARGGDRARIWSAGCSTGEEAYTLALLACEALGSITPPVEILATDISSDALERARDGIYRPYSVREIEPSLRRRYFTVAGEQLMANECLRSPVRFVRHNLVRDPAPPLGEAPFDLILCRNVLIYFDSETVTRVLGSLEHALADGGTIMLGVADALCASASGLGSDQTTRASTHSSAHRPRTFRRPLGKLLRSQPTDELTALIETARAGHAEEVVARAEAIIARDPLNAPAYFLRALGELADGDAASAVDSLRRALYAEPQFGLAAFRLGHAYEDLGNVAAAVRAYEQALRTLATEDNRHEPLLGQIDLADVAAAARSRLEALGTVRTRSDGFDRPATKMD